MRKQVRTRRRVGRYLAVVVWLIVLGGPALLTPRAHALQVGAPTLMVGAPEPRGSLFVLPIDVISSDDGVGALQFSVDHPDGAQPRDCEVPAGVSGLAGSCRIGTSATQFSIFTLQGLGRGSTTVGMLIVDAAPIASPRASFVKVADPAGNVIPTPPRGSAPTPPSPTAAPPTATAGVAPVAAEPVASTAPVIGTGVAPITQPSAETVEADPVRGEVPAELPAPAARPETPAIDLAAPPGTSERTPMHAGLGRPPQNLIAFVGPATAARSGFAGSAGTVSLGDLSLRAGLVPHSFGPTTDPGAVAAAVLSGCLVGGAILVANRRAAPVG